MTQKKASKSVREVRKFLKDRLFKEELRGLSDEKNQLLGILKRTVEYAESDSVLVIGQSGAGKSTLVNTCLEEIKKQKNAEDTIVVRLNGVVHTDDNLALKDIILQLHVDELQGDNVTGSFSDNLLFLINSLNSGKKDVTKPIIFILDEFQLFCNHRNQTLLYNLFDIAMSAKAPICVVGITCRFDILELLEKRVKSRYSHRQILLFPSNKIEDRLELFTHYLTLPPRWGEPAYVKSFNENILTTSKEPKILQLLRRQLEVDPSEMKFKAALFQIISRLTERSPLITAKEIEEVYTSLFKDAKVELLKDLSVLELCLVIAMSHQVKIYDGEPFNFEMIAARYLKFASKYTVQMTEKPVLFKAFERLMDLEVILSVPGAAGKGLKKEYQFVSLALTFEQVKEGASAFQGLPTEVSQWAFSIVV